MSAICKVTFLAILQNQIDNTTHLTKIDDNVEVDKYKTADDKSETTAKW